MSGVIIEVSARKFAVPFECVCCGAAPETDVLVTYTRAAGRRREASTRGLRFPYCQRCADHVATWEQAGVPSAAVVVLGMFAGIVLIIAVRWFIGVAVIGVAAVAALLLAS